MNYVFKEQPLEADFSNLGYCVVNNFLSSNELNSLLSSINQYSDLLEKVEGFSTSTDIPNIHFREKMRDLINEIVSPKKIQSYIEGYTSFYSNLLIKNPSPKSEMCLHTDWSITDEEKYRPLQIWIPLVNVNKENGTLGVLPSSQKYTIKRRGCFINEPYVYYLNKKGIVNHLHYFEVEAGTAVFYHPGIMHYSPSNFSNHSRIAILVSLYPTVMEPVLYFQNSLLGFKYNEVFKLKDSFFSTWDKKSRPNDLEKLRNCKIERNIISNTDFEKIVKKLK